MTKRDFEMIASVIASLETEIQDSARFPDYFAMLETTVEKLADEISESHPRFNRGHFEFACLPIKHAKLKAAILAKLENS